ncbi:MAG TPA: Stk1 family PASTA domain-containing Ser/Thr kinase, partial [Microthrixaceae bacterium]|nr:Stk1 family PASTA domain-containing Ser/Thr kinase [Microthrixaceae bacterium]
MTEQTPRVLNDRYEVHRRLARGGMAQVYLARDRSLDRPVAVKELVPEFATDPNFVERFRREAQAAAGLSHANIVGVYDWGAQDGTYFIVMEYVDGPSLSQVLRADGPVHPRRAAEIASEVAAGLGFAHSRGVVHRDVKPGNVLLTKAGVSKVTDFGIARALSSPDDDLTQAGSVMGTATYFSPEQAQGISVDPRSDLYSLGVVLYEMVTGRPPFSGDTPLAIAYRHVQDQPAPPSTLISGLPRGIEAIIMKLLQKSPDGRYASAEDLRVDLGRYLNDEVTLAEQEAAGFDSSATQVQAATTAVAAATGVQPAAPEDEYDPEDEEADKPRTAVYIGVLVLLLAVFGGLLAWFLIGSSSAEKVAVPSVIGHPQAEAERAIKGVGLKPEVEKKASSSVEAGIVLSQDPGKDTDVEKGSTVKIVVSSGTEVVQVPNVLDLSQVDAERILTEKNLLPRTVAEENADVPAGTVISQDPKPLDEVPPGSVVNLVVSKGVGEELVPDVIGRPLAQAQAAIQEAGLRFANATEEPSSTIPQGSVISVDPGVGTSQPKGTLIRIVVSSGPEQVRVPTVTGQNESGATETLKAAKFNVDVKFEPVSSGDPNIGRVISQDPPGGTNVDTGSTVTITVGVEERTT